MGRFGLTEAVKNLDGVTSTGAGAQIDGTGAALITFQYTAATVTSGGTLKVQGSLDGTNWTDIKSWTVSASGSASFTVTRNVGGDNVGLHNYYRTNLTARTDGTFTTKYTISREP